MASSTIILLARLKHFGEDRALDDRLGMAYRRFADWLHLNGRTSSLHEFSKQKFGIEQSFLGSSSISMPLSL